jgi:hypothetical protein
MLTTLLLFAQSGSMTTITAAGASDFKLVPAAMGTTHRVSTTDHCFSADFVTAEVVKSGDQWHLKVTGRTTVADAKFRVSPVLYVKQPDYWQMVIEACNADGRTLSESTPYSAEINISGSIGSNGISLSGGSRSKPMLIDVTR